MTRAGTCVRAAFAIGTIVGVAIPAAHRTVDAHASAVPVRPNVIVIVTDDQRFDTMDAMPITQREIGGHGVTFTQAITSNALCCPSRAALLLGAYSRTSHVYTNNSKTQPYGGWPAFSGTGDELSTIAVALHDAGYRTALFGKYFNDFIGQGAPPGWDRFAAFFAEHDGGAYYDYELLVQDALGVRREQHFDTPRDYSTTVIGDMALRFLRQVPAERPFLLYLTPYAPHGKIEPAPVDAGTRAGTRAGWLPRLRENFNEADVSDKPQYIRESPGLPRETAIRWYRETYEALASVDRLIGDVVDVLRARRVLSRTLIVFISDNGWSFGEHRWNYKMNPHEESIRVPLLIRYDPLTASHLRSTDALVSNVDIVPTIAEIAGVAYEGVGTVDGRSLVPLLSGTGTILRTEVLLEHLDFPSRHPVPTYCGIRTPRYVFVRYQTGERELYDLVNDPFELRNATGARPDVERSLLDRTEALCDPPPPGYTWG